ncbi:MAG TPA: transposase [Devosia sp.]|nr:transposase [Devosia sp.]
MARPLRIEFPGALYHITSRGDRREAIYNDAHDRRLFMGIVGETCERYNWSVHAWCLMTNHYHLLVETPDANLSRGMRHLNGVYTQCFNRKHGQVGHVFQGRYKAILVEKEAYLLELSRYVVLNPVRAKMVASAGDWPWSSYLDTVGFRPHPEWFDREWLLSNFHPQEEAAVERYVKFVSDGVRKPSPWHALKSQIFLGSDQFVEKLQSPSQDRRLREVPMAQQRPEPKPLSEYQATASHRNEAIVAAYLSGGYTLRQIGEHFSLHYSTVSRIIRKQMQK